MNIFSKYICLLIFLFSIGYLATAQPSNNQNYIITNNIKQAGVFTETMVPGIPIVTQGKGQSISYFDGLGRPVQTIITQGSANGKDIISSVEYDSLGREVKKYLPFVDISGSNSFGGFRSGWNTMQSSYYAGQLLGVDASSAPYSQTILESSPMNRPLAQGAPGAAWQPNLANPYDTTARVIKIKYETNRAQDSIRIFNIDSLGNFSSPGFYGKPTQTDPLTPSQTDPGRPFQIDPLSPAQIDPL